MGRIGRRRTVGRSVVFAAAALVGCGGAGLPADLDDRLEQGRSTPARAHLADGLRALNDGALESASAAFNRGLEVEPRNANLNFLNAFAYHARVEAGETALAELAEVGYRLALRFNPNHWLAAWQLGRLLQRDGRLPEARDQFANAVLTRPGHAPSVYSLAAASYALGDPQTAASVLDRLAAPERDRPAVQRAQAMVSAALDDRPTAQAHLARYRSAAPAWAADRAATRLAEWGDVYDRASARGPTADTVFAQGAMPAATPSPSSPDAAPPKAVVLDVVLVSQETATAASRGINLLSALEVQFGGTLINTTRTTARDVTTGAVTSFSDTTNSDLTISVPSVTYSLNIANSGDSHTEIVARPTLLAHDREESEVFIGSEITYVATGTQGGQSYNKEVGVTLRARPDFLADGRIRLRVSTEFSSFLPTAAPGSFDEALATIKNRSTVTAEMRVGQTLAIAAGTTQRKSHLRQGVPILRDIPILQYFFSTDQESSAAASLMILLTPRTPTHVDPAGALAGLTDNVSGERRTPAAVNALKRRYRDWFEPTSNTLVAMHRLLGSDLHREFRRGDIQFAGLDGIPEPTQEDPTTEVPRYRAVIRDFLDTLYF